MSITLFVRCPLPMTPTLSNTPLTQPTFPLAVPRPLLWGAFHPANTNFSTLFQESNEMPEALLRQLLTAFKKHLGYAPPLFSTDATRLKKLTLRQTKAYLSGFIEEAQTAELIHLQHDFSVFTGAYLPHQGLECFAWLLSNLCTASQLGTPILTTFHHAPTFLNAPLRLLEQWAWSQKIVPLFQLNTPYWAVCHHATIKQQLIQAGFCAEKIYLVPHFVPEPSHLHHPIAPQLTQEVKQRLHYKPTDVVLGLLGFMSPAKRYEDVITALKFLPNHYKLLIIGGSNQRPKKQATTQTNPKLTYEQRLVQLIYEAGLENRVLITGLFLDEQLPSYINCVDLFIAPYSHQVTGYYNTINLLITANKPLIAANCPAFVEIQHQAQCFAMFEAQDPQDLSQTIQQVHACSNEQHFLLNALKTYTQEHCALAITNCLLSIYQQSQQQLLTGLSNPTTLKETTP